MNKQLGQKHVSCKIAEGEVVAVSLEKDLSLTLREKQALDRFKEQVGPLLKTDFMRTDLYLIRWLRARNFDVNAAEEMLKENLRWREQQKMDQILHEDFHDMFRDFPSTVDTQDREGRPIGTLDMGDWNIREAVISGKGPRLLRYLFMLMEVGNMNVSKLERQGMNVSQWVVLVNAEGVNMITQGCPICIPLWIQFVSAVETHYHGWADELIIIEAPTAAYLLMDILLPPVSCQTSEDIWNEQECMDALSGREVSKDQRNTHYGGTRPHRHLH